MDISDLPPDLAFARLPGTAEARDWAFEVKRAAMGPHIAARWGWDEAFQRDLHARRFAEKPFHAVLLGGRRLGTVSWMALPDGALRLGEFYLPPEAQGRGLGTRALRHLLALADARGAPVRLEHLRWNPVGRLYARHGFVAVGGTDVHVLMERPVGAGW